MNDNVQDNTPDEVPAVWRSGGRRSGAKKQRP